MSFAHPLDPITPEEVRKAVQIVKSSYPQQQVRFKLVDIFEVPKAEVVEYLENERLGQPLGKIPSRRARVYFHFQTDLNLLNKARVNITTSHIETVESLPNVQGPVDFDEWSEVEKACNEHPDVLKEIAKLKLPAGYDLHFKAQ